MKTSSERSLSERQLERRQHIRYPVSGSLEFDSGEKVYKALPINLGLGGIMLKGAEPPPAVGTTGTMRLNIKDFHQRIEATARIIRTHKTAVAARFLNSPSALVTCITWLAAKDEERQAKNPYKLN